MAGQFVDVQRLTAVCHQYGGPRPDLFGSAARGSVGPAGDVDALYILQPGRTPGREIDDLADDLADLFGRPVDLLSRRALHTMARDHVLAEARPAVRRDLSRSAR